jgi:BASS family bile acid:Na+ symporter
MNLATITNLLIVAALLAVMLSMGLKVQFAEVVASARQTRLVLLALLANFVLAQVAQLPISCVAAP